MSPADAGSSNPDAGKPPWWNPIAYCLDGDAFLFVMTAFGLGALGFLNTWDYPIYLGLATLAYGVGLYANRQVGAATRRLDWPLVRQTLTLGAGLGLMGLLLYILFYLGFSSQASGILPYIFPPTQLRQYFLMFGPFLVILTVFLAVILVRSARQARQQVLAKTLLAWLITVVGLLLAYVVMMLGLGLLDMFLHLTDNEAIRRALGNLSATAALGKALGWRLRDPWLLVWLSGLVTFAAANILWHVRAASGREASGPAIPAGEAELADTMMEGQEASTQPREGKGGGRSPASSHLRLSPSVLFVSLLIFTGVALTFSVEFFYLRDSFGTRMNTVFKFYYQGWVMMACASAYGIWWMLNRGDKLVGLAGKFAFLAVAIVLVAAGMFYPVLAYNDRVESFNPRDGNGNFIKPNIDGSSSIAQSNPDDWAAINWLNQNVTGTPVILEAPGHSYDYEGRISAFTGLPAVLGWALHESQWRGNYNEQGKREPDIAAIYTTRDEQKTIDLLHKWNVSYVILGGTERLYIKSLCDNPENGCAAASAYKKFDGLLPLVFDGNTKIYAVP